jgi:hypothetical protein
VLLTATYPWLFGFALHRRRWIFHRRERPERWRARVYARDCARLAGLTEDQEIRVQLLNMAREWMGAAIDETRREGRKTHF